jgi:hypothetical protein
MLTKGSYQGIAYCPFPPLKTYNQINVASDNTFQNCDPHFKVLHYGWYLYIIESV